LLTTKRIVVPVAATWKDFFQEGNCGIFLGVAKKIFPEGAKSGEFSF